MALLHHEKNGVVNHGGNENSKNAVINLNCGIVSYKGKSQGRYNGNIFESEDCTAAFVLTTGLLLDADEQNNQGVYVNLEEDIRSSLYLLMMYSAEEVGDVSEPQLAELINDKKILARIKRIAAQNNKLFLQLFKNVFLGQNSSYINNSTVRLESVTSVQNIHNINKHSWQRDIGHLPAPNGYSAKKHKINKNAKDLANKLKKEGKVLPMPGVQLDNSDLHIYPDENAGKEGMKVIKNQTR
jgi:hypothetical protein